MPRNIIIENKKKLIALKKLFVHKTTKLVRNGCFFGPGVPNLNLFSQYFANHFYAQNHHDRKKKLILKKNS